MLGLLGEFLLELIIELVGEAVVDSLTHVIGDSGRWRIAAHIAAYIFIYGAIGAVIGVASLLVFPYHLIRHTTIRAVALLAIPMVAGVVFALVGRRRRRAGKQVSSLEAFVPAFAFALAMSAARYFGAM